MSAAWHAYFATLVGLAGGWISLLGLADSLTGASDQDAALGLLVALIVLPFTVFGVVALLT